jgi:hypothetical protein
MSNALYTSVLKQSALLYSYYRDVSLRLVFNKFRL